MGRLFGLRYWRAGAMYRGSTPSPLTTTPFIPKVMNRKVDSSNTFQRLINLPETNIIEVVLELVEIKNLPQTHKKCVGVFFSKARPDGIFDVKRKLNIESESGKKQVATFRCQPTGYLFFELVSESVNTLGHCFISLEDFFASNLSAENWLDLVPSSGTIGSDPIRLRVAASCTVPIPGPHVLQITRTQVTNDNGNEILGLQMREMKRTEGVDDKSRKELIGITKVGETVVLGKFLGSEWSLMDSLWSLKLQKNNKKDANLVLTGPQMVKLVPGRKLDYDAKHHERQIHEHNFITAVEFSAEYAYGRAIALLDVKSGLLTLQEARFALPGIMAAFIVLNILRNEGYDGLSKDGEILKEAELMAEEVKFDAEVVKLNMALPEKDGGYKDDLASDGCGGGCGSGYGNIMNSGGCGRGCGGGCGNMVKSSGCGGGGDVEVVVVIWSTVVDVEADAEAAAEIWLKAVAVTGLWRWLREYNAKWRR